MVKRLSEYSEYVKVLTFEIKVSVSNLDSFNYLPNNVSNLHLQT